MSVTWWPARARMGRSEDAGGCPNYDGIEAEGRAAINTMGRYNL